MPAIITNNEQVRHTDDMQDIITTVPSWLLRWGITLFFCVLVLIVGLSALVRYPDIVKAQLKVDSPNSPKPVVSKISGKLVKLLVTENETVKTGQPLAYLESTANHDKVLNLLANLKELQKQVLQNRPVNSLFFTQADNVQFGELQSSYQVFFQEYLSYKSSISNGFDLKKKVYLQNDLASITKQEQQLNAQKSVEQKDFSLAGDEYAMHTKLAQQKVETSAELRQEESKYLAKKSPLIQTESALIAANNNYSVKQKEILELDNQIVEERSKFLQALNSLISEAEDWKSKYVLTASQTGKLTYSGIIQENQVLTPNQEIFYINPGNEQFFGEMEIPQNNMGKVREGQQVLIKLKSYPFEEYGILRGRIKYIADIPYKDSVFISKVDFNIKNTSDMRKPIHLKQGMMADAEIVTQDATILQRISRSVLKAINNK
ncbi:MAG: HlyD family efflux transporter periplasmic adaptor subunit [Mucilaginibacter sp.]|nr:HlyD family efflux transporter periplasmic adaptor subunit [Mucilaginibacter sp.]